MIESYQLTSSTEKILSRFILTLDNYSIPINEPCTISKGSMGFVITSENERELRQMKFGLTPHWSKKPMDILTARAEGDKNQENDPSYNGPNAIFLKPAFKKAIQQYRCLVVAESYTDYSSKQPKLISFADKKFPSVFAGIYDYWKDPDTGIIQSGFAIITVPAIGMLRHIGIKRMPVILSFYDCKNWIKAQKPLNYYLPILDRNNLRLENVISLDDRKKPGIQVPTKNITDQQDGPLPKRYYGKSDLKNRISSGTIGDRIVNQTFRFPNYLN